MVSTETLQEEKVIFYSPRFPSFIFTPDDEVVEALLLQVLRQVKSEASRLSKLEEDHVILFVLRIGESEVWVAVCLWSLGQVLVLGCQEKLVT